MYAVPTQAGVWSFEYRVSVRRVSGSDSWVPGEADLIPQKTFEFGF